MKYNFCTLFDSGYLSRGLALYHSLESNCDSFHIYIFAFDDKCFDVLTFMKLEHATIIHLKDFENEELIKVKPTRNKAEYCWTCAPSTIWYSIHKFNLSNCTYIDADLLFYNSPEIIFNEIGNKSAAITQHKFVETEEILVGKYCVQFNYFKNDEFGLDALKWWRDSCIEWCFARFEDGKYADQKYMDELPTRFKNIHVIQHRGAGVAQWNIDDYLLDDFDKLTFIEKATLDKFPILFYHFHYTRYSFKDGVLTLKPFKIKIPNEIINGIYIPYIKKLALLESEIKNDGGQFKLNRIIIKRLNPVRLLILQLKFKLKRLNFIRQMFNLMSKIGIIKPYKGSQE